MLVKTIVDEDFVNYKKPSMFIGTATCGGKCCIEAGIPLSVCQNDELRSSEPIDISLDTLIRRYIDNSLTQAIVFGGLEPFEQIGDVLFFVHGLREEYGCNDDVVIYTGYYPHEVENGVELLRAFPNVIVKYGRFIPDRPHRFDDILGVELASDNQYAERIS